MYLPLPEKASLILCVLRCLLSYLRQHGRLVCLRGALPVVVVAIFFVSVIIVIVVDDVVPVFFFFFMLLLQQYEEEILRW